MTSAYLQQWIQHPEMLNKDTLYELRTLVARYPYFQSLRLLYLKNLYLLHDITFGAELRKAVLYVADRRVLFYLIEGDRYTLKSRKPSLLSSKVLEEEHSVDRTLSLIDAFLATIPEEHSQVTELDYTMDYTTYLLQDDGQSDSAPDDGQEAPKLRGHELIDGFIRKSESTELSVFERPVYLAEDSGAPEEDMQKAYFYDLLNDLFNFYSLEQAYKRLLRMMDEEFYKLYPKLLAEYKELAPHLKEKVVEVSNRFRNQYTRLINENENYAGNEELQQRIHSGAAYFCEALLPVRVLFDKTSMPLDNKELRKQLNERLQALDDALWIKESLLDAMRTEKFTVTDYLKRKAKVMLSLEGETASSGSSTKAPKEKKERKERTRSNSGKVKIEVPTDILHPELYRALSEWRTAKTREVNMPAYVIMQQKALMGIVNLLPDTPVALEAIPYFGAKGVEKYGLEILGIVRKYMKENKLERPEIFTSVSGGEDVREQKLDAQHHEDKKKQKEKKKDSKLVSYEMFCQGMTIEEIAKTRDLVTGTIAAHLEHYLREDKIKLEQVVTADKIKKVRTYLETHEFMGVVAIKAALGDEVSYADIRFVLATAGH